MDDQLQELFALPVNPQLEAVVDGQKFYSSENLKQAFLKSIGASGRTSTIYKPMEKLVYKKKLIVPCFLSKGMFKFFMHKMFGNPQDKSTLAFYHMKQKRVFILIDNTISPVGTANNDEMASTTVHECVHLYADGMRSKFNKTFKEELYRYYVSYFSRVFELKTKPSVENIIKFVGNFEYQRSVQMNKQLTKYFKLLEKTLKPHTTLDDTEFRKRLIDTIVIIKYSLSDFNQFIRMYRKYTQILTPLNRAYQEAFGKKNTYTTPFQELSSVSEVISVYSELKPNSSKIKKMFKELA